MPKIGVYFNYQSSAPTVTATTVSVPRHSMLVQETCSAWSQWQPFGTLDLSTSQPWITQS